MPNHNYPPIGRCIYCDNAAAPMPAGRFSDEHIIPLALGGNLVLQQASCDVCAQIINKEIETPVLLKEWKYFRIKRNFPTRGKSKKPTHVNLRSHSGSPIQMPIQDYPAIVPLYKFNDARLLSGAPRTDNNMHWTMEILGDSDEDAAAKKKYPNWNGAQTVRPQPYDFARLLAKMSHARAAAEYGLSGYTPLLLDIILGRSDDYFLYIGGGMEMQEVIPGGDHLLNLELRFEGSRKALLLVHVRLFSQIRSPAYHVVVGDIDLDNPQHVQVFERHRLDQKFQVRQAP